ncbi:MAG: hypothetical protein JNM17_24510 [Archangium sp.]|nr:hypothetical protein [Archangium sp.]
MIPAHALTLPKEGGDLSSDLSDHLREGRDGYARIRCPKCAWRPTKESLWSCGEPCWHAWNTFDTAGRCPKCDRVWLHTACLACHQWSPHLDWYEHDAPQ